MGNSTQGPRWTDIFIRRPVLAVTLSTVITVLGIFGISKMTVREYPEMTTTVITVTTSYSGASPQTVQSYITQPLGRVLGSVPNLDYMTSNSSQGLSTLTLYMKLDTNPEAALTNTLTMIKQVEGQLPQDSEPPVVTSSSGSSTALMYIAFYSPDGKMSTSQIVDYVVRTAQPLMQTVSGVSQAQVLPSGSSGGNGNNLAARIWLNPVALAAYNLTPGEIVTALKDQNVVAATGDTQGDLLSVPLTSNMEVNDIAQFRNLVVKTVNGTAIRLKDVAKIEMGAENYTSTFYFNGQPAVAIAIQTTPTANDLNVATGVSDKLEELKAHLPPSLKVGLPYNAAEFIHESISEVIMTVGITLAVVIMVIFVFLGSLRSLAAPALAIPLSIAGAGFFMYMSGYSLNLMTLLAIILAIGLVVDDAIVMVENIHRHIDEGKSGFQAAILSGRELRTPIIVTSTTLIAVYLPVAFSGGVTGALFTEFAFTIVFAVVISTIIALTLTPVASSRVLKPTPSHGLAHALDKAFDWLRRQYERSLRSFLEFPIVGLIFIIATLIASYLMLTGVKHQLSPPQNSGVIFAIGSTQPNASPGYVDAYGKQVLQQFDQFEEKENTFMITGFSPTGGGGTNGLLAGMQLKPFSERTVTATQLKRPVQQSLSNIAGLQAAAFTPPPLPGATGTYPIDFVLTSSSSFDDMARVADEIIKRARDSHRFLFLQKNLKIDQPQYKLEIDRKLAGDLGVKMTDIAKDLQPMLSGAYVSRFTMNNYAYKIIPQTPDSFRALVKDLGAYYVRSASGQLIPLATLIKVKTQVIPEYLPQFNRINSVTIQGLPMPGVADGEALQLLAQLAHEVAPSYTVNYEGMSRQFVEQGNTFVISVVLSLIMIYLLLSAQFNSFRDALIVMFTVPMSAAGALIFMDLGFASLNIYTQIALITLIGLITKQGILVVQFANDLRETHGMSAREAVEEAAGIRLRAILMTTLSMVLGVIPLIVATGSGAPPRNEIGIVIAAGLGLGALFSLYIVPVMYLYLAKDQDKIRATDEAKQKELDQLGSELDRAGEPPSSA